MFSNFSDFFGSSFFNYINLSDKEREKIMQDYVDELSKHYGGHFQFQIVTIGPDGKQHVKKMSNSELNPDKLSISDRIKHYESELDAAVNDENYEKAAELRDVLNDLKENYKGYELKEIQRKEELNKIQEELTEAVKKQDFEKAAELKKKRDDLNKK